MTIPNPMDERTLRIRVKAFDEALHACLNYRKHAAVSDAEKTGAMECALAISDMKHDAIRKLGQIK